MEIKYPQTLMKSAGNNACYAMCVIKLASEIKRVQYNLEFIGKCLDLGFEKKFLKFNKSAYLDSDNFYCEDPAALLSSITGKTFRCKKETRNYEPKKGEWEVLFMTLSEKDGASGIGHFTTKDFHPNQNSKTETEGFVYSKRIFYEVKK